MFWTASMMTSHSLSLWPLVIRPLPTALSVCTLVRGREDEETPVLSRWRKEGHRGHRGQRACHFQNGIKARKRGKDVRRSRRLSHRARTCGRSILCTQDEYWYFCCQAMKDPNLLFASSNTSPCSLTYLYLFSLPSLSRLIAGFSASNKVQVPAVEGDLHLRLNMRTSLPEPHPRLTSSSLSPIDLRMLLSDCRFITSRLLYNSSTRPLTLRMGRIINRFSSTNEGLLLPASVKEAVIEF